jgi:gliding motility-associated-like protein
VSAGPDIQFCLGSSGQLLASGAVAYNWLPISGLNDPAIPDPFCSATVSTVYTVTGTDANGCKNFDSVAVTVLTLPAPDAGPDQTICEGDQAQLTGSGGSTYSWQPALGLSDPTIANPLAQPATTTTYTVTVTDANGCPGNDSVTITVNPVPVVSAGPDIVTCIGMPVQLSAAGGINYSWQPASSLSDPNVANPMASPNSTTTYTVTVTDANGCVNADSVQLTVFLLPPADAGPDQAICPGDTATLSGSGGVNYQWQPAGTLSDPSVPAPHAFPAANVTYTITVTDVNGCVATDSVTVTVHPAATASAGLDQTIVAGESIALQGSGGGSYLWSPPGSLSNPTAQNPIATPLVTTMYFLVVTSPHGCLAADSVLITVVNPTVLDIPTAFTPNGDGLNDIFAPIITSGFSLEYFVVYNRWGDVVFETNNPGVGWDGTYEGVLQPISTFVFIVRGRDPENQPVLRSGNVTLLR